MRPTFGGTYTPIDAAVVTEKAAAMAAVWYAERSPVRWTSAVGGDGSRTSLYGILKGGHWSVLLLRHLTEHCAAEGGLSLVHLEDAKNHGNQPNQQRELH